MTNLFSQPESNPETPDLSQVQDPISLLVGEGKKYKTPLDLVTAVYEKDSFIETLKKENTKARDEANKAKSIEELVDKLMTKTNQQSNTTPVNTPVTTTEQTAGSQNGISLSDVEKVISDKLTQAQTIAQRQRNVAKVEEALKAKWGDGYKAKLNAKPNELGVSQEYLSKIAEEAPEVFIQLVAGNEAPKVAPPNAPRSSFNSSVFNNKPTGGNEKNYNYYRNLRKSDPRLYASSAVQMEMHTQAKAMGDSFYN